MEEEDVQASALPEEAEETKVVIPLGRQIDEMYELRAERTKLTSEAKKLGEALEIMERDIINRLDLEESTMSRGKVASAVLTETQVAEAKDWDAFYEYIHENEAYHLLQRRPAGPACRETIESGETIPGISMFTKRAISLTKSTK